jgi:membrane protease YdiL (CAAX protease family)
VTTLAPPHTTTTTTIRQYSRRAVLAIWAAAALPMGLGAWVIAPLWAGAHPFSTPLGSTRFAEAIIVCFTVGLVWQFLLVLGLVWHEQRSLRWAVLREALWLRPPSDATRQGGRLWWWGVAAVLAVGVGEALPIWPHLPAGRDFGKMLGSDSGHALLRGNWGLLALTVAMAVLNTVLGEELIFRGLLLPRMAGAFGRADWVVNSILFGLYHWHQPWSMPKAMVTGAAGAYATRRWRSAWLGIIAHSAQSVVLVGLTLAVVLS